MPPPPPPPNATSGTPTRTTRTVSGHRPLVGVSTKMYFSHARTTSFVSSVLSLLSSSPSSSEEQASNVLTTLDAFIIPTFTSLTPTLDAIATATLDTDTIDRGSLLVGAQNCCSAPEDSGAYTGEVSAAVLREIGCALVEVGHAERRKLYGETDAVVRDKVAAVVRNGMWPLICVGEVRKPLKVAPGAAAEAGKSVEECEVELNVRLAVMEVVRQVEGALKEVDGAAEVVLAYEPVWAIGAAEPASAAHVRGVVRRLRESEVVKGRSGRTRIVYGGAAGPGLWEKLGGEVDGLFLGRFAHQPEQFVKMLYEVAGWNG